MAAERLPLSVWPTAQETSRTQRKGRYVPASTAHPAKMLPALARIAIEAYTTPGDLVVDPMCGVGTTLVEAAHLGRHALGIELEAGWAELARANLDHAAARGATGTAQVVTGDGRDVAKLTPVGQRRTAALVLTSPPYGPSLHGRVATSPRRPVTKWGDRYTRDRGNLGNVRLAALLDALAEILAGCVKVLRADGLVVLTARPWRRYGALIDLPGLLERTAAEAGLVTYERNVALLAGLRGDRLVPRASFFQMHQVRRARQHGTPRLLIAHEDVLVFRKP